MVGEILKIKTLKRLKIHLYFPDIVWRDRILGLVPEKRVYIMFPIFTYLAIFETVTNETQLRQK